MSIIELKNICKSFGNVHALRGVNFSLKKNEIVGLLGDNGAGKSTLIKIISGVFSQDQGNYLFKGKDVGKMSPQKARSFGIETVYQNKSLGDKQEIWRNFFMGRHLTNSLGFIKTGKEKRETLKIIKDTLELKGVGVSACSPVSKLSGGERQGLAIGRAMYFKSDIIILDEPTTALAEKEVNKVINFIKSIKVLGKSCILISHNLKHVYDVADRFVIISGGKVGISIQKKDINLNQLTEKVIELASI